MWIAGGVLALGAYGFVATFQPDPNFGRILNDKGVYMGVMTSRDAGLHWSAPAQIAPIRFAQLFVPDDNFPIRAEDYLPDIAVDMTSGVPGCPDVLCVAARRVG